MLQVTVPLLKAHGVPCWLAVQLTVPPLTVQLPLANWALTKLVPTGTWSVTTTPLAVFGPRFTTPMP